MSYPSIITQQGSSARNVEPISERLRCLLDERSVATSGKRRILEIGSYPYEHIRRFASDWPEYEWYGSGRDKAEVDSIRTILDGEEEVLPNLRAPFQLDIGIEDDWERLRREVAKEGTRQTQGRGSFQGVLLINIIHCCPSDLAEQVFKQLSPLRHSDDDRLLDPVQGWIATYGPFLNDDGTFKSVSDEEFNKSYIQSKHPLLGLRSISSIDIVAQRWGFRPGERTEMPKGNTWVVWRTS